MPAPTRSKGGYILRASEPNAGDPVPAKPSSEIGMRQLFDDESSTYTYLLWDKDTEDAILVDPVVSQVKRDLLVATGLNLIFGVNTHVHADHVSGTALLRKKIKGSFRSVISKASKAKADELIEDGDEIHFGGRFVRAISTPGHTVGCMSYATDDGKAVMTGDALLVMGCGRTDFQSGSADDLYDSVHQKLFSLPDDCVVFPAHDYEGRMRSTIGEEKTNNPRLGGGKTKSDFIEIMQSLNLPKPSQIDVAVPANLADGVKPFFVRSLRTSIKQRWGIFG